MTVRNGRTEWGCEWQEPSDRDERDSLGSSLPLPYRPEGPWPDGMRRGWTEWMTRGYGPPYCFRSLHGSCLSSPFSHVIPLASLRSCSVPFRSERGEGWKTEPSDENGKGTGMNETNRSAPSVLSLRLVTFPGCFHVVYSPPSLVSCRFLPSVSHSVRITPLRFAPLTTLLPEGTDEPVRRWYDGSECKVRGSGAVHVSLRSSHLRPFGPLFVSRSAPRAAPLPPAARIERWRYGTERYATEREWKEGGKRL